MPSTDNLVLDAMLNVLQEAVRRSQAGGLDPVGLSAHNGQEVTLSKYMQMLESGRLKNVQLVDEVTAFKARSITVGSAPMYGCTGIFGLCGPDDVAGLTMKDDPLIEWLGFYPDTICERFVKVLSYIDQAGTSEGSVVGTVYGAPCDDPPSTEKDMYEIPWGDFGTMRMCGEGVPLTIIGKRKCDKQPVYTLPIEGVGQVRIDNDLVLETIAAAQGLKHEMSRAVLTYNSAVQYQFPGLQEIVNTGYVDTQQHRRYSADSLLVDWQSDNLDGLVNGHGNIVWKIRDIVRRLMWRINQSSYGPPAEGDMVLMMPSWLSWAFLDAWAYASLYTGQQYEEVFRDNLAIREFRNRYANGLYGGGYITIDGFNLHIIPHDWQQIEQDAPNFCSEIYVLTRRLGGERVLFGQYMPAELGRNAVNQEAGFPYYGVEAMKAGRALKWMEFDNACVQPCMMIMPRLWCKTPWAQARLQNVCVSQQFDPYSLDPQSSYFIEPSQYPDENITQYWYDDEGWFH